MKLHLPKVLLNAILFSSTVYAGGYYQVGEEIRVDEKEVASTTDSTILDQLTQPAFVKTDGDKNPYALVKNGAGTLEIANDATLYNPLLINEGKVSMANSTITSERDYSNATCGLSIGAAELSMDNSHFQLAGDASVYAICIGNSDGAATLNMTNGSTMGTKHYIFAGYTGSTTNDYRSGLNNVSKETAVSTINISSGSQLTAGTSLQFANVEINIDGTGSVLADNGRNLTSNQWPESYIGYGYEREVNIEVTNGGKLDFNWNVYAGTGHDSNVIINVGGIDDETKTASSIDVAGVAYLGMVDDYDYEDSNTDNYNTTVELNVTEGAKANIAQMVMGVDAATAKVNIGEGSTYDGVNVRVGANGTITNDGTMTLTTGETTDWLTDGNTGGGSVKTEKEGTLLVESGKITNNGTIETSSVKVDAGSISGTGMLKATNTVDVKNDGDISTESLSVGRLNVDSTSAVTINGTGADSTASINYKDGEGTVLVTGTSKSDKALYVREGAVHVKGDAQAQANLTASLGTNDATYFSVAGKDSQLIFENANYSQTGEGHANVGGQDGSGTLIIKGGSVVDAGNTNCFSIGVAESSINTPNPEDDSIGYSGTYHEAKNGSGEQFGRGDVVVSEGSKFDATFKNFMMGEGSLTATGAGTEVTIGHTATTPNAYTEGDDFVLGYEENTTSEINVTDGAKLTVHAADRVESNYSDNTTSIIKVDGGGSQLNVSGANTAAFGNAAKQNTSTSLEITGGASANFETQFVTFGSADAGNKTVKVDVLIGEESSLTAADYVYLREGATIENAGTLTIEGHSYIWARGTAAIINSGTINSFVRMNDNSSLTALDGSTIGGALNAYAGTSVYIQGQVSLNGEFWMQGGSTLIFTLDSSIDMNGNQVYGGLFGTENFILDASSDSSITDLESLTISQELFTNYREDSTINDDTVITVKLANGDTATTTLGALQVIPEPTTATLSLLALAGLAARRRRR